MRNLNLKLTFCLLLLVAFISNVNSQTISRFIITDQFGYLPGYRKVAVIKDPKTGFDATETFTPGSKYALVDAKTGEQVFEGAPSSWKSGTTDASSGDRVWHFDFTQVTKTGRYYVLDVEKNLRSYEFQISPSVYNEVLKHAVRTFFYQRAGYAKAAQFAGPEWADGASHVRNLQDKNARIFDKKTDPSTERDVSGGWYDAGDYNKYTNWTADYVVEMMKAYLERPEAWTDDYNIPESGNGIPDLLDEAKWGIDHLRRMQLDHGGVLSIVGLSHASPPSAATGPSYYGPPSTSATLNTAAALAISSRVFRLIGKDTYADTLRDAAIKAWNWAVENPAVIFRNNESANGSSGLGAGQQEVNDYGRLVAKIKAACYLFEVTGEAVYRIFFDNNYRQINMFNWNFAYPFELGNQDIVLYYTTIPGGTASVKSQIKSTYRNAMVNGSENLPAMRTLKDSYIAHIKDYTWGSNSVKCAQGSMYYGLLAYEVDQTLNAESKQAAIEFIHYIHGRNPLNMVYLSNMYKHGAENCVNEFYHTWFSNNSPKWDRVGKSTYGPAPGFLTGGPNPSYNWDGCCPGSCGSAANNALCNSEPIIPPRNQPNQKSYKDFNTSWPLNSWSVTENSCGYQVNYIRLLSKFVDPSFDCNGDSGGDASIDICGKCAGGNTGRVPVTNAANCLVTSVAEIETGADIQVDVYPNPSRGTFYVSAGNNHSYRVRLIDADGRLMLEKQATGPEVIDATSLPGGLYLVIIQSDEHTVSRKVIKL